MIVRNEKAAVATSNKQLKGFGDHRSRSTLKTMWRPCSMSEELRTQAIVAQKTISNLNFHSTHDFE